MSDENSDVEQRARWARFKREHPRGSWVTGLVKDRGGYGVWLDLGDGFEGCLLTPYIARDHFGALREDEVPALGATVRAMIRHYGDDIVPDSIGAIALTQDVGSLWVRDQREK